MQNQSLATITLASYVEGGIQVQAVGALFKVILGLVGGLVALALGIIFPVGGLYWMWVAIQIGSFWMFVLGVIPPAWPVTSIVGAYSLLFGVPHWVFNWFA